MRKTRWKNNQQNRQKVKFSDSEIKFLLSNEACRIATVSSDSTPHITPYIFEEVFLYFGLVGVIPAFIFLWMLKKSARDKRI
jgi:anaerobic C4-dicarboxylate transporter